MRIPGTEPSSVILAEQISFKRGNVILKRAKTTTNDKGWWNKPTEVQ